MDENNIDSKRLDDMRKSVKGKLKEREEDRNLGVKPKKSSSQKVKSKLNASKGKGTQKKSKKSGTSSKKSASKKGSSSVKGGSTKIQRNLVEVKVRKQRKKLETYLLF